MLVRFLKAWRAYQRGEVAGFDELVTSQLISNDIAVAHDPEADPLPIDAELAVIKPLPLDPEPSASEEKKGGKAK